MKTLVAVATTKSHRLTMEKRLSSPSLLQFLSEVPKTCNWTSMKSRTSTKLVRSDHYSQSYVPSITQKPLFDFVISGTRSGLIGSSRNLQIMWTVMKSRNIGCTTNTKQNIIDVSNTRPQQHKEDSCLKRYKNSGEIRTLSEVCSKWCHSDFSDCAKPHP